MVEVREEVKEVVAEVEVVVEAVLQPLTPWVAVLFLPPPAAVMERLLPRVVLFLPVASQPVVQAVLEEQEEEGFQLVASLVVEVVGAVAVWVVEEAWEAAWEVVQAVEAFQVVDREEVQVVAVFRGLVREAELEEEVVAFRAVLRLLARLAA
jgi:hypothetical protein